MRELDDTAEWTSAVVERRTLVAGLILNQGPFLVALSKSPLNLNGVLVIRQMDNTSGGKSVPGSGSHKRCELEHFSYFCNQATMDIETQ